MYAKYLRMYNTALSIGFIVLTVAVVYQLGLAWLSH